jgi:rubrerythrin
MAKIVRLTESDLIRLVKRVIAEQEITPDTTKLKNLKSEVSNLESKIAQARRTNAKQDIDNIVESCKNIWEGVEDKIAEMKQQLKNERDERKRQQLLDQINKMESLKNKKQSKLDELVKKGSLFTKNEKLYLTFALEFVLITLGVITGVPGIAMAVGMGANAIYGIVNMVKRHREKLKQETAGVSLGDYNKDDFNYDLGM